MAGKKDEYVVVWSGRMPLLPEREERSDSRIDAMPTYDLDDDEVREEKPKRKYNKSGKHVGKFSRTDPNAPQYRPTKKEE